jgi:hypothetical protein
MKNVAVWTVQSEGSSRYTTSLEHTDVQAQNRFNPSKHTSSCGIRTANATEHSQGSKCQAN